MLQGYNQSSDEESYEQCGFRRHLPVYQQEHYLQNQVQYAIFAYKKARLGLNSKEMSTKRLNKLSPPSAHFSLLTLRRNLGICPGCIHLQHKILKLGKRNLNVQPVTSLSFYFQAAIFSNRKIQVNIKQHGKAFLKLSLSIKCIDAK